ncbi:ABC transporter [filamentous cyanobacterium CCP1]|nr:ABC transporter [filamentous cyanobacterium CCP2]PSB67915.1 ABC transporter [filamentous cyanobacterium CCP1]
MLTSRKKQFSPFKRQWVYLYDLLRELVSREMKLLYKRSFLGVAWTLINPLLQLAVFVFVFQVILPIDVPQYSSFVFTGLLVWTWFQSSLFQSAGAIIGNRALIRQPGFPNAILPIVTVSTGLVHFTFALPVLIIFLLIDGVQLQSVILFLPVLQIIQFAFTVSLSYFFAALNVTFRDTQHTLGVLLQLLFYITPIFYAIGNIPSTYQTLYFANPIVHFVSAYRAILIDGVQPNWFALFWIAMGTLVVLPIGIKVFQRQSHRFVEEL